MLLFLLVNFVGAAPVDINNLDLLRILSANGSTTATDPNSQNTFRIKLGNIGMLAYSLSFTLTIIFAIIFVFLKKSPNSILENRIRLFGVLSAVGGAAHVSLCELERSPALASQRM
jgi:uncharacterized membrane protein